MCGNPVSVIAQEASPVDLLIVSSHGRQGSVDFSLAACPSRSLIEWPARSWWWERNPGRNDAPSLLPRSL